MGFDAGDSNLYRYVNNSPVNGVDPSGLEMAIVGSDVHTEIQVDLYVSKQKGVAVYNNLTKLKSKDLLWVGTLSASFGAVGFQGGDPEARENSSKIAFNGTAEIILSYLPYQTVRGERIIPGTWYQDVRLVQFILKNCGKTESWLADKVTDRAGWTEKIETNLKNSPQFGRYSAITTNCNHFTSACITAYVGYQWSGSVESQWGIERKDLLKAFDYSVGVGKKIGLTPGFPSAVTTSGRPD